MPEPIERCRHQFRNYDVLGRPIQAFQERGIDQVEEIQEPDPGNPSQEMHPAKDHLTPVRLTRANAG